MKATVLILDFQSSPLMQRFALMRRVWLEHNMYLVFVQTIIGFTTFINQTLQGNCTTCDPGSSVYTVGYGPMALMRYTAGERSMQLMHAMSSAITQANCLE